MHPGRRRRVLPQRRGGSAGEHAGWRRGRLDPGRRVRRGSCRHLRRHLSRGAGAGAQCAGGGGPPGRVRRWGHGLWLRADRPDLARDRRADDHPERGRARRGLALVGRAAEPQPERPGQRRPLAGLVGRRRAGAPGGRAGARRDPGAGRRRLCRRRGRRALPLLRRRQRPARRGEAAGWAAWSRKRRRPLARAARGHAGRTEHHRPDRRRGDQRDPVPSRAPVARRRARDGALRGVDRALQPRRARGEPGRLAAGRRRDLPVPGGHGPGAGLLPGGRVRCGFPAGRAPGCHRAGRSHGPSGQWRRSDPAARCGRQSGGRGALLRRGSLARGGRWRGFEPGAARPVGRQHRGRGLGGQRREPALAVDLVQLRRPGRAERRGPRRRLGGARAGPAGRRRGVDR